VLAPTLASIDRHLTAAGLLLRFEDPGVTPTGLAAYRAHPVEERPHDFTGPDGRVRGRLYVPRGVDDPPGVLLVHGVHRLGMDEPRLVELARVMASTGFAVLTPQVEELASYRVEPKATAVIAASAGELSRITGRARAGVIGISFAGGLALLAAADPDTAAHIGFVVAIGAHHDLRCVAGWYVGEPCDGPDGQVAPVAPHPYGAGVLIYRGVERFFAPEDVDVARAILASLLDGRGREARARLGELSETGREEMERVFDRTDDAVLRPQYLAVMDEARLELAAVSPAGRIQSIECPVFLLHGEADPIIPSTETLWLARETPPEELEDVVVTPFLRHAETRGEASWEQRFAIVHFMAGVVREARRLERRGGR